MPVRHFPVETWTDQIDEIPGAYKDIDAVMDNQQDLTETVQALKQVVHGKG